MSKYYLNSVWAVTVKTKITKEGDESTKLWDWTFDFMVPTATKWDEIIKIARDMIGKFFTEHQFSTNCKIVSFTLSTED